MTLLAIFKGPEVITRTSVVTQDTSSPGKGNSHESMLWAIFLMHHFIYAIVLCISEETSP